MLGGPGDLLKIALCKPQIAARLNLGEEDLGKEQLTFTGMVALRIATKFIYKDQTRRM